eukprot:TRINITY_DN9488_c0_g2_i1.p1 TRINITY_DN9488_c0_g2~~TRINITY_DN9488_c0_g2_i1.p1  ORF type:complete len:339 (-),score=96.38 TRINITY_DN9488_c0_g2_i1:316-1332(-)
MAERNYPHAEDLAAALRDSSARKDFSLSSVYRESALASANRGSFINRQNSDLQTTPLQSRFSFPKTTGESKQSFWSSIAKKAKSALLDEGPSSEPEPKVGSHVQQAKANLKALTAENPKQKDAPIIQKSFDALTNSLTSIGGSIGNALEEGLTIVENKASDIISDTKRSIKKKANPSQTAGQESGSKKVSDAESKLETQLKASRDVAMAMAAKVKVLLRELKTLKADLAFAKERCAQLEEENRTLREGLDKGDRPDEDLIRLQLETLLAEKARLAQENSDYARENRFLREIVEYHQLTMQDVVQLDENMEEVAELDLDANDGPVEGLHLEKSYATLSR